MSYHEWLLYCLTSFIIVYTPGPMTLFSMANGITVGYRKAFFGIVGGSTAYVFQMLVVMLGIGVILQQSHFLFSIIKILGAGYLFYLAIKQWQFKGVDIYSLNQDKMQLSMHKWRYYVRGFFIGLSNPKAILVFTVLFPHFIKNTADKTMQFFSLGLIFLTIQFISSSTYAVFGMKFYSWIHSRNLAALQGKIFALMLIIVALLLFR